MEITRETLPNITPETMARTPETRETAANPPASETTVSSETLSAPSDRLVELLRGYGYQVNDKNMAMLTAMTEQGIPLTKENVARMNQALKLTDSMDKALFMFANQIRLTQANNAQLNQLLDGFKLTPALQNLLQAVSELNNPQLAERILQILQKAAGGEPQPSLQSPPAQANAPQGGTAPTVTNPTQAQAQAQAQPAPAAAAVPLPQGTATIMGNTNPGNTNPTELQTQAQAAPTTGTASASTSTSTSTGSIPVPQPAAVSSEATSPSPQPALAPSNPVNETQTPLPSQPSTAAPTQPRPNAAAPPAQNTSPSTETTNPTLPAREAESLLTKETAAAETSRSAAAAARFTQSETASSLPRLSVPLTTESTVQEAARFMQNVREALQEIRVLLTNEPSDSPAAARVLQEAQTLSSHLDFTSQIKTPFFVQIPLFHNGQETQAALHILRNPKKDKENAGGSSSALIALDTAYLGLFETFVQKTNTSVSCQFRLKDENVEQLVRANIHQLDALLREKHYALNAFSFLPHGEPYSVLDSPKLEEAAAVDVRVFDKKA